MKTYTAVIVCALAAVLTPAIALTVLRRPRPFKYVLRGGEASVCLAITVDTARRLALITSGVRVVYPGDVWAIINICMLSVTALLLWSRVAQLARHDIRAKNARDMAKAELKAKGLDVDSILKQTKRNT